jgi:hypothetical protein
MQTIRREEKWKIKFRCKDLTPVWNFIKISTVESFSSKRRLNTLVRVLV